MDVYRSQDRRQRRSSRRARTRRVAAAAAAAVALLGIAIVLAMLPGSSSDASDPGRRPSEAPTSATGPGLEVSRGDDEGYRAGEGTEEAATSPDAGEAGELSVDPGDAPASGYPPFSDDQAGGVPIVDGEPTEVGGEGAVDGFVDGDDLLREAASEASAQQGPAGPPGPTGPPGPPGGRADPVVRNWTGETRVAAGPATYAPTVTVDAGTYQYWISLDGEASRGDAVLTCTSGLSRTGVTKHVSWRGVPGLEDGSKTITGIVTQPRSESRRLFSCALASPSGGGGAAELQWEVVLQRVTVR